MTTLSKQWALRTGHSGLQFKQVSGTALTGQTTIVTEPGMAVGSELVWLRGVLLDPTLGHYTVDYDLGAITPALLEKDDTYLVRYIDGAYNPWSLHQPVSFVRIAGTAVGGETVLDLESNVLPNSEQMIINGVALDRVQGHYTIVYSSGKAHLLEALEPGDTYLVIYSRLAVATTGLSPFQYVGTGNDSQTDFYLPQLGKASEWVFLGRTVLAVRGVDYDRVTEGGADLIRFLPGRVPKVGVQIHVALG